MYRFRGNGPPGYDENRRSSYASEPSRRYDPPPPGKQYDTYRPESQDFKFRAPPPPGVDLSRMPDAYRPPPPPNSYRSDYKNEPRNNYHNDSRNGVRDQRPSHAHPPNDRFHHRPIREPRRFKKPFEKTAERAILLSTRQKTPELMAGMAEEDGITTKYIPVEDLSDSDETDMDVSESDSDSEAEGHRDSDQPKKKQARTQLKKSSDGDSIPRWSNPDPYSVLPPVDESQRKTKDVVKLIRKARVTVTSDDIPKTEAVTDDFISFDFDEPEDQGETQSGGDRSPLGLGVTGAPTGPRAYSHRESFQQTLPAMDSKGKPSKKNPLDTSSDPALGNRKRNIDDEITGPPRPIKKPGGKGRPPASGKIISEWKCPPGVNATPWCKTDHSETANMGQW